MKYGAPVVSQAYIRGMTINNAAVMPVMHTPDGFLDHPVSLAAWVVALGFIVVALMRSRAELGPLGKVGVLRAGLVAGAIFAAQMINFPVSSGTSGHLLGGALAVALVGPWTAVLILTSVLAVQAFVFADGGIMALGVNIVLMAVVGVFAAYGVMALMGRVAKGRRSAVVGAGIAALASVPAAALTFVAFYAAGGAVAIPLSALAANMLGWHALIGVGEAAITLAVVAVVVALRPDMVWACKDAKLGEAANTRVPLKVLARAALGASALTAGGLSLLASSHPDGLEFVAGALGFEGAAQDSVMALSPLADYALPALGNLGNSAAGLVGLSITLLLALTITWTTTRLPSPQKA